MAAARKVAIRLAATPTTGQRPTRRLRCPRVYTRRFTIPSTNFLWCRVVTSVVTTRNPRKKRRKTEKTRKKDGKEEMKRCSALFLATGSLLPRRHSWHLCDVSFLSSGSPIEVNGERRTVSFSNSHYFLPLVYLFIVYNCSFKLFVQRSIYFIYLFKYRRKFSFIGIF